MTLTDEQLCDMFSQGFSLYVRGDNTYAIDCSNKASCTGCMFETKDQCCSKYNHYFSIEQVKRFPEILI